ncbi:recombinase family protein [Xylanimonas allomyrinae]|uniref:Recombinase family protein n=1 Tax=Xylanimonas allomyrinae TaxID=2509459 RepID=A0A4P6EK40_9MICO|nr:recombinase family protein [Xylanimonas allomyrinae]QAY62456.1 recombinase family protein [Xylanimonas allomyrinae]
MDITQQRKCALYARLSVTKEESVSIERQLSSGRRYAEARGWAVVGEFVDDGVSATANRPEDRKGWRALLVADGYDAVVIWKVDRLARRVLDFLHADEALQARGAGLVAVEDPIDMTSPQGRAFAVMLAVFGEMEAEAIRARVRAARVQLLNDGRWPGGGVPYGFRSAANPHGPGRVLAVDPHTHPWLGAVAGRALQGVVVNALARWLTEVGAPLPEAARRRRTGGTVWNRQTVEGLLRNPILAGMTPHNPGRGRTGGPVSPMAVVRSPAGDPVVNLALAVITVEEFIELQRILDSRDTPQARKVGERLATSPFLSRVVVCDDCSVFMCRGTNQRRPVLTCPSCRQTLSRAVFDDWLIERLLTERGSEPLAGTTVQVRWGNVGTNDTARREILLSQIERLRVRRGVVGRRFDADRVLLEWRPSAVPFDGCQVPPAESRA